MLKFLKKIFSGSQSKDADPVDTDVPEENVAELLDNESGPDLEQLEKNLQKFIQFLTASLSQTEARRLWQVARTALYETESSFEALQEVMSGDDGQRRGQWLIIQLDWKASEEIGWQVSEILATLNAQEQWDHDCEMEFESVPAAFQALSEWLAARELALLHFETDSDSYCAIIIKGSDVAATKQLAEAAQLTPYDQLDFSKRNC
ncbi:hypothetical protein KMZ15_06590 [Mycoavidus sp. HKI]|uniref:DUF6630 family protein n=1 Tax=Mycoavidus sp. HKI TaxID=2840467 RepID=UPI0021588387|nr:hypothetical protein [Mycoavidus sp. HKI]UAW63738.2 hypothetical protein KMZ15_06590 [Mycoavidus sp. HKI]